MSSNLSDLLEFFPGDADFDVDQQIKCMQNIEMKDVCALSKESSNDLLELFSGDEDFNVNRQIKYMQDIEFKNAQMEDICASSNELSKKRKRSNQVVKGQVGTDNLVNTVGDIDNSQQIKNQVKTRIIPPLLPPPSPSSSTVNIRVQFPGISKREERTFLKQDHILLLYRWIDYLLSTSEFSKYNFADNYELRSFPPFHIDSEKKIQTLEDAGFTRSTLVHFILK